MADEDNELTPNGKSAVTETDSSQTADRRPPPPPRTNRFAAWLGYGTLLLIVALVVAGVFLLQELRSKQEGLGGELNKGDQQMLELTHQITGLQAELAALHSQFATLQSQVTTEDATFERIIGEQGTSFGEKLESTRSDLDSSIQHIQQQLNKSRGDLMVADAEYLLSIANQKLHLVGDVKAVLAAMEAADQRLHDSGDPAAYKVRVALAEEIDQLKKFEAPDVVGISARLLALESKTKALPLFLPHADMSKTQPDEPESKPSEPSNADAKNLVDSTLHNLRDLVKIRRTDRPIEAVLAPEQAEALRQVLLLKLEMTRAALLRGDDAFYKANLESAQAWLGEHFDGDAASTKSVAEDLRALGAVQLSLPFPDVSKSLAMLRNIEKLRLEAEERAAPRKAAPGGAGTPPAPTPAPTPAPEPAPTPGTAPAPAETPAASGESVKPETVAPAASPVPTAESGGNAAAPAETPSPAPTPRKRTKGVKP
ncbi:uroporphyrinogen-III C-methyltransferase [Methylococcus sp. EFPC2]|uniref:uroporphyrinogen-III C-methyltransferase n=1 Tax=Methylococcus sp. EFPC2 TaxID=2812648 RepID=UPI001966D13B|nr:uroporphyrinogen-III C-methyltransferase [Methylococcus sp. EFPC2]QSA96374.1 uroporphyrinogen-III C-methyltransferase [Methylococcus sp. EFPC2]